MSVNTILLLQVSRDLTIIVKPKSSPKAKSQIQVPNSKSKVQRKGTGTEADNIILQATHLPPTSNFSHLKFDLETGMRGQNGVEFY